MVTLPNLFESDRIGCVKQEPVTCFMVPVPFCSAFPDYLNARKNYDRTGFNGVLNDIYNDRIRFAHPTTSELPTLLSNIKSFISYMALYVYTVAKYYKE